MATRRPMSAGSGTDIPDLEDELVDVRLGLARLQRMLSSRRLNAGAAEAAGISLTQQAIEVLRTLGSNDAMPVGDLARAARMDTGAVSRQLRVLEAQGLVERRASEQHGSIVLVVATERGRSASARYERVRSAQLARALSDWEPQERLELGRLLIRLVDDLQAIPYIEDRGD